MKPSILLILILACSAFGQGFDENVDKMPDDFTGKTFTQIANIISEIEKPIPDKGEFEKKEQYEIRLAKIEAEKSALPRRFASIFNYQISTYDADNEVLNVETLFSHFPGRVTAVMQSDLQSSSYRAGNVFGASVTVRRTSASSYKIAFVNAGLPEPLFTTSIKISSENAKNLKSQLRTLVYFEIVAPYFENTFDSKSATMNSPSEASVSTKTLLAKILQVWIIDSSGTIYAKKQF